MSLRDLFREVGIPFTTEGKNCKPGWLNTRCPHCGDTSNHLGVNIESGACHCWRCGGHDTVRTLCRLLHISRQEVQVLLKRHGKSRSRRTNQAQEPEVAISPRDRQTSITFPSDTSQDLYALHIKYLEKRGFDVDELISEWQIHGTGPCAYVESEDKLIDYRYRILIPIFWGGQIVSYQTRDVTSKTSMRYLACPRSKEVIHHKHILYRHPSIWENKGWGICVEGITDVWKLGRNAFATFGVQYTQEQVRAMTSCFSRVFILYDGERVAQMQARKLLGDLAFAGVHVTKLQPNKLKQFGVNDPGELNLEQAEELNAQIERMI